ncbi:hypothetical protein ABZ297_15645 [Nonomuraea sp. NPDC005983]|uniref:hypothetical protein n=1 Tax=Nonomuraea sp. NPDC005983 TaxID=3155595 RepID=UPI0033A38CC4
MVIFVVGLFGAGIVPAQQLRLMAAAPEAGTLLLSLDSTALYLGMSAGGALGGVVLATLGATALAAVAAAVYLPGLVAAFLTGQDVMSLPEKRAQAMEQNNPM